MEQSFFDLIYFLHCPGLAETFLDVLLSSVPIWLAVMIDLVIGCSWRPRWTGLLYLSLRSKIRFAWIAPPRFGARRFWLAFTAFSVGWRLWSKFIWKGKDGSPVAAAQLVESGSDVRLNTGTSQVANVVVEKDLEHLLQLIENKGGKMEWQSMMGHSTSNLTYQAWRHDLEVLSFKCWKSRPKSRHLRCSLIGVFH
ncbi:uncharacterized protein LOC114297047 [Camellia sinensis]|uniref:uncharacterized protein LOC114297047 n=1 Tax=Camellia sinensis TaxID=4442 RepID=UPI001035B802|nr:uncharacterized protein LOC114297047 [Camellia sinensis]